MFMERSHIPCSWREVNIVKMSLIANLICRFNSVPIKIPGCYFMAIDKLILKFIWRGTRQRIANIILKNNKLGGLMLPDFKT